MKLPRMPHLPISKNMFLILGAVVLAAISVVLVKQYLDNEKKRYQSELTAAVSKGMVQVVVPVRDVPAGTVVDGRNMSQRLYPRDLVYEDAITVEKWREFAGRLIVKPIRAGKPLLMTDFVASSGSGFAGTLPADTRAVTISVDSINSLNGLIQPGDHVDVLLSQRESQGGQGTQVLPLLRRTQVLATGRQLAVDDGRTPGAARTAGGGLLRGPGNEIGEAAARNYNTITVAVSPVEASSLVLAQQLGQLRVVLASANRSEGSEPDVPRMTQEELIARLGGAPPKPAAKPVVASAARPAVPAPSPVAARNVPRQVEFIIGTSRGAQKTQEDVPAASANPSEALLRALGSAALGAPITLPASAAR